MEKMLKNKINDEELDQISGGKNLFDVFTAEFRGGKVQPTTLELNQNDEDDIKLTTLVMRTNPLEKKDSKKTRKIIKL